MGALRDVPLRILEGGPKTGIDHGGIIFRDLLKINDLVF